MELINNRVHQMKKIQDEGLILFTKKNQDYGDAFARYGIVGVLVRMGDKISRFQSVTAKQVTLVDTESLRDTLIDLHNYSAMAIMLLDEDNKRSENKSKGYLCLSTQNNNYFDLLKKNNWWQRGT
tara:strand:+ start:1949 stop:2323 length:375 start_codon:yes stop_codon:yes gene_type:complete